MVLFTALKMVVDIVETNQLLHPQSKGCNAHPLQQKTLPASMRHSRKVSERTLKKLPNARAYFPIPLEIHEPEQVRPLRLCPRKRQHIPSIHG